MTGFDEPYWNSLQLLGWVYLRVPDVVNRCSDDGGGVRWHLEEANVPGKDGEPERRSFEEPSRKPSTLTITLYAADDKARPFSTMEAAEQDIHWKLQRGAITATGKRDRPGTRQNISVLDWIDLRIDFDQGNAVGRSDARPGYRDLRFERAAVLKLWPEVAPAEEQKTEASTRAKGRKATSYSR